MPPNEQSLLNALAELRMTAGEFRDHLRQSNDLEMQGKGDSILRVIDEVTAINKASVTPNIADNLGDLFSALKALDIPISDPDFGPLPSHKQLRAGLGLLICSLLDALKAAAELGLEPHKTPLPEETPVSVSRRNIEHLLTGISRRVGQAEQSLRALSRDVEKHSPQAMPQQQKLVEFYVGAMRVEMDLMRLHLKVNGHTVDIGALARLSETMATLAEDFTATLRGWGNRVELILRTAANRSLRSVTRVAAGIRVTLDSALGHVKPLPGIDMPLARVSANQISGLIEALAAPPYDGKADLPDIAYEQELEVDELFPVAEAMQLLRFADVEGGDIKLTDSGRRFSQGELDERKEIFSRALRAHVPLAAYIRKVLKRRAGHAASRIRFMNDLKLYMSEDAAEETLGTVVSWGLFGELFSYNADTASFSLET